MKLAALVALALLPAVLHGHSLSYIEGEAVVHRDRVELALTIRPEDILLSAGVNMIVSDSIPVADLRTGAEAHKNYLLKGIVVEDGSGHLAGSVRSLESPRETGAAFPVADLMATNFVYRLTYPMAKPPERLGFRQLFNAGKVVIPVIMQVSVRIEGQEDATVVPVPDGEKAETLAIDWSGVRQAPPPVVARPLTLEASDAFLYVRNDEVRLEILMPLPVLETWLAVPRAAPDFLEIAEQTALQPALEQFFVARSDLRIDGVPVKPRLERLDFFGIDYRDFAVRPPAKRLSFATSRLGAILSFPAKGAPRRVELRWTFFNEKAATARAVLFAYDKAERIALAPAQPAYTWTNPGAPPPPRIEVVLAAKGAATEEARAAVAEALLRNVYRGFDYRSESDIYDALAQSVQGELLTNLYLQIRKGLTVQEQGGAVATVQEVSITRIEPGAGSVANGFSSRVTWQVTGTVEHWGHIHTRVNEYAAEIGIARTGDAWKIVALDVTRQSQIKSAMSVRKL